MKARTLSSRALRSHPSLRLALGSHRRFFNTHLNNPAMSQKSLTGYLSAIQSTSVLGNGEPM